MTVYRPKSTLKLILYGFGFVTVPLVVALGFVGLYVDRLGHQSQNAVYQAVQAISASRELSDTLTTMERSGRQYVVLADDTLLANFESGHAAFRETVQSLQQMPLSSEQREQVETLAEQEQAIYERISQTDPGNIDQGALAEDFRETNALSREVLAGSNRMVDREVDRMQDTASTAQQLLFWLALALAPLTVLSVTFFTAVIAGPIRQLDRAIRRLGGGDFQQPIALSGPRDLQYIGERLDWLRQRLLELEEQKTRFLRHVSHELKTPLTAIREGGDLLADPSVGDLNREQRDIAGIITGNAGQLQRLIDDLLNFSTARDTATTLTLERTRLGELVQEVARNHRPAILSKDLDLQLELQDVHVDADTERLRTVVDNLLANAVKFSPTGGAIQVALARVRDTVVLSVSDQGPGIPTEEREQVFDAFFQGRVQAEGTVKGSGLGLAIARESIEAHGGRIELGDSADGGALVRVILPLDGRTAS